MRLLLAICLALPSMLGAQPSQAQEGWPWSIFNAKPAKPKRATPRSPDAPKTVSLEQPTEPGVPKDTTATISDEATAAWRWRIMRTSWSERDEKGFEEFVQRIGESGCRTVHACLTAAASNPLYRASNPAGMHFYADCADLPYMLRAYFAWKNGLPFSYSTAVTPLGFSKDIRYTARGNMVASRRDLVEAGLDARRAIPGIVDTISSAHYRYPPSYVGRLLPDHYPVKISRESIKPGTVIYDPNGHVAVVYKVTPEGRIHYIDTHPDNSLTRGVYGKAFARSTPAMGAGFKRWRPLTLVGATQRPDGTLHGGRVALAHDKDIADWSDEQFFGTAKERPRGWQAGKFAHDGERLDYYDFVRKRLARTGFKYDPVDETRSIVRTLCEDLKYRVDAVDVAVKAGVHVRAQPDRLPNNIYGTDGDWETYSTPSRDARLKTAFKELRDEVARFVALADEGSDKLAYSGTNIRRDLRQVYLEETSACSVTYARGGGSEKQLSFGEVARRLYRLSFDPYHCAERRWGAHETEELATCTDGADKRAWYDAQQRLRNQPDRTYDVRMGFSLADLRRRVPGSGIDQPPDIDVLALLPEAVEAGAGDGLLP
jgi:hypothetical protein